MFVRTASARDVAAIRALLDTAFAATYGALLGPSAAASLSVERNAADVLEREIAHPAGEFIVADDGAAILGLAYASADRTGEALTLHRLYVHPARLGHGIGSLLMDEVLNAFPDARTCGLEVAAGNARAIAFYRGYGFRQAGEPHGDPAHVRMERALGSDE